MAEKLSSDNSRANHANIVTEKLSACTSALEDLMDIYNNKFLTDVNLKTKTNTFPAHKVVLCARSPVFKLMFTNELREKNSCTIQIDDLEDDTVQQLLMFLYCDSVESLQWESATKLYHAADKYQIEKLKLICSSFLILNLTVCRATELLLLADSHNDSDIKHVLEDFISEHGELVFRSKEWEEVMEIYPQLALKLMPTKFNPKTGDKINSATDDSLIKKYSGSFLNKIAKRCNLLSTPNFKQDVAKATKNEKERYQQKQIYKFQDSGIRNITPKCNYCEKSNVENKTRVCVDCNYFYNQRQTSSKVPHGITFKNLVSPDLNGHEYLKELNTPDILSDSMINKKEKLIELPIKGEYPQRQIDKFQNTAKQNISPENICCGNSGVDIKTNSLVTSHYTLSQIQGASESTPNIYFQGHAPSELHKQVDSTESSTRKFPNPDILSGNLNNNQEISKEFYRRGQRQKQINKFQEVGKQNFSLENNYRDNTNLDYQVDDSVSPTYHHNQRQELSENAPYFTSKKRVSDNLHGHITSTETKRSRLYKPENLSERMVFSNETSSEDSMIREDQQRQINKNQYIGIQKKTSENSCSGNFDAKIDSFISPTYHHNQRQELSESAQDITSKKRVSNNSSRYITSTETERSRLYKTENLSERIVFSKETSAEKSIKREDQQGQMNKNQYVGTQKKTTENSCSENFDAKTDGFTSTTYRHNQWQELSENAADIKACKKRVPHYSYGLTNATEARKRMHHKPGNISERIIISKETSVQRTIKREDQQREMNKNQNTNTQKETPQNSFSANSDGEKNNAISSTYLHNQRQESFRNSSDINFKKREPSKLNKWGNSTDDRRRLNFLEKLSQRISSADLAKVDRFVINCFIILIFSVLSCFAIKFFMDNGYLPTLYEKNHLNTTSLVNKLRSNFKEQPPLTFRLIGSVLKNLESEPKAPAIILLLATNGSKTICSEFASNLINLLSVPKNTVRIYGENFKEENGKQVKLEIDQIISKSLKFNQLGSVLIEDVDQIPGEGAIILHKYYDHEYAPFKKAVFVMTADYNMPIRDYHDLKVWQKAANDHLLKAWADAGIDQVTALLSRLIVSVAVITSDTLY